MSTVAFMILSSAVMLGLAATVMLFMAYELHSDIWRVPWDMSQSLIIMAIGCITIGALCTLPLWTDHCEGLNDEEYKIVQQYRLEQQQKHIAEDLQKLKGDKSE